MKMRNLIIGLVAVAFVAGGYLGGFVPKLGFGPGGGGFGRGGGSGPTEEESRDTRALVSHRREINRADDRRVARVRIDSRDYFLLSGTESSLPATLDQIVSRIRETPGDDQGIRVRVQRSPNSKTTAEIALRDALAEAGVAEDAIEWLDGPPP